MIHSLWHDRLGASVVDGPRLGLVDSEGARLVDGSRLGDLVIEGTVLKVGTVLGVREGIKLGNFVSKGSEKKIERLELV